MSENTETRMLLRYNELMGAVVPMGAAYNPPNQFAAVAHMQSQATLGQSALDALDERESEEEAERNARQLLYSDVERKASDVFQWCRAAGWSEADLADLQSKVREMRGAPSQPKPKDDPDTPDTDESETGGSSSQTSYASLEGHWSEMVAQLTEKGYASTESGLKLSELTAKRDAMRAANIAIADREGATAAARQTRDEVFYTDAGSIVNSARFSKTYLGGLHEDSQAWQTVKGFEFRVPPRLR